MAYTSIYDKILRNPYKITWLDMFSDSLKKHSRQDMEYAMIAGTSMDSATCCRSGGNRGCSGRF